MYFCAQCSFFWSPHVYPYGKEFLFDRIQNLLMYHIDNFTIKHTSVCDLFTNITSIQDAPLKKKFIKIAFTFHTNSTLKKF